MLFALTALLLFLANLWFGSVILSWKEVLYALTGRLEAGDISSVIVLNYRLPQSITALATGAGLAVSGLLLQTLFRNPLAGPSVLGISSGASLGVALVILSTSVFQISFLEGSGVAGNLVIIVVAFLGALAVLAVIVFVANRIGSIVTVLIIGIMIGYAVSAVVGVLQFFSRAEELHAYVLWGLGSFSKTNTKESLFLMFTTLVFVLLTLMYIKPLNALLLGNAYARSVGVDTAKLQTVVILIAGMLIAASTAFSGPIAFLGLAVPHMARGFFQTSNHRVILPAAIIIGGGLALLCNLIARLPGYDTSLPINAVTSVIGAPIVIWVIVTRGRMRQKKNG